MSALQLERAPKAHRQADPVDHLPGNVSDDPANHPRRNLTRKRPLRPRLQQVYKLALQPAKADRVHHGGAYKQPLRLGHVAGDA